MKRITQFFVLLLISTFVLAVPHPSKPWVEINYPQDKEKRWWDDAVNYQCRKIIKCLWRA